MKLATDLSNDLSKLAINDSDICDLEEQSSNTNTTDYVVMQHLDTSQYDIGYISTVSLNFHQLWAMFGRDPVFHSGKCKYEWRIKSCEGFVFSIYDWNNPLPLLQTREWHIGSNGTKTQNTKFLRHLGKAINCYNKYYTCMEEGVFNSKHKNANECMKELQVEIKAKLAQFQGV
jgi:hypothetical protein